MKREEAIEKFDGMLKEMYDLAVEHHIGLFCLASPEGADTVHRVVVNEVDQPLEEGGVGLLLGYALQSDNQDAKLLRALLEAKAWGELEEKFGGNDPLDKLIQAYVGKEANHD